MMSDVSLVMQRAVFSGVDFSGMDFQNKDMSHSVFENCNFDNCNLSGADCSFSLFNGSTFRNTNCYRANFRDAKLGATVFEPSDCFGMTVTLECGTFKNMQVSQLWFYSWLMLASEMLPASMPVKENLLDSLIAMIGSVRFVKLREMFGRRDW